jgi:hypothetical protein
MALSYDITAVITCLPTEVSGRIKPFVSGYRSQFFYENHDWDVQHLYNTVESVAPGQTALADLKFLSPEFQVGRLYVGKAFQIREGQRTFGQGYVQAITGLMASAKQRAAQLKLRHFKCDRLETRGDAFAVWGKATYYFACDKDGLPIHQFEIYENGVALVYDDIHAADDLGMLTDKPLDLQEFASHEIALDQFWDTFGSVRPYNKKDST